MPSASTVDCNDAPSYRRGESMTSGMLRNALWLLALGCAGCTWDWDAVDRAIHPPVAVPDAAAAHDASDDAHAVDDGGPRDASDDGRIPEPPVDGEVQLPDGGPQMPDAEAPDASDGDAAADGSEPDDDAGEEALFQRGCAAGDRALGSASIAAARAASDGSAMLDIHDVLVTYVRPALGTDPAGFFVQAEAPGPAIFVSVNSSSLAPRPEPGDCVQFRARALETFELARHVAALDRWELVGTDHPLEALVQDVSAATDVISDPVAYESELASGQGVLERCDGSSFAGARHVTCNLLTTGLPTPSNFRLRTTQALADALDIASGCTVTVTGTPLWRHLSTNPIYSNPTLSAYHASEIAVAGCPAPVALSAVSTEPGRIRVRFDRHLAAGSVDGGGAQFSIAGGPAVLAAELEPNGRSIVLTTAPHTPGAIYMLAIDATLTDTLGTPHAGATLELRGYDTPAVVLINEVARIGCDQIELRAVRGGSLDGFTLHDGSAVLETFDRLHVAVNDYVIVNLCDGTDEYSDPAAPASVFMRYENGSTDSTIQTGAETLSVFDAHGELVDAALFSSGLPPSATQLAWAWPVLALGGWSAPSGVALADIGFDADAYVAAAVLDIDAVTSGTSMQRIRDLDTDSRDDWDNLGTAPSTLGANNAGQEDL